MKTIKAPFYFTFASASLVLLLVFAACGDTATDAD